MANKFFSVILMQFLLVMQNTEAQAPSSLNKGSTLEVERHDKPFLISEDGTFACGFYPVGENAFTFSIWITNSINRTVVWTANRDSPVNGCGSKISFRHDGNLVLRDVNGSMVWSTSLDSSDASKISFLNSGNLVINNTKDNIRWQSFDSPTDTLLPSQPLRNEKRVVSAKVRGGVGTGYYSFYFDSDNVLKLMYSGSNISSIYWPYPINTAFQNGRTTYNNSRLAVLDETGQFTSSDSFSVKASDVGESHIIRRLTLDFDGNLRMYSLNRSDGSWEVSWEAFSEPCSIHGLCGQNGICQYSYSQEITCSCLPGFVMNNPTNWHDGCKPKFTYNCDKTMSQFKEFPQVDFFGFDISYTTNNTYDGCKNLCLQNCDCMGFSYRIDGKGFCYQKTALTSFPGRFYLRLPIDYSDPILNTHDTLDCTNITHDVLVESSNMFSTNNTKWSYIFICIAVFGALETVVLIVGWWFLFRERTAKIN